MKTEVGIVVPWLGLAILFGLIGVCFWSVKSVYRSSWLLWLATYLWLPVWLLVRTETLKDWAFRGEFGIYTAVLTSLIGIMLILRFVALNATTSIGYWVGVTYGVLVYNGWIFLCFDALFRPDRMDMLH